MVGPDVCLQMQARTGAEPTALLPSVLDQAFKGEP